MQGAPRRYPPWWHGADGDDDDWEDYDAALAHLAHGAHRGGSPALAMDMFERYRRGHGLVDDNPLQLNPLGPPGLPSQAPPPPPPQQAGPQQYAAAAPSGVGAQEPAPVNDVRGYRRSVRAYAMPVPARPSADLLGAAGAGPAAAGPAGAAAGAAATSAAAVPAVVARPGAPGLGAPLPAAMLAAPAGLPAPPLAPGPWMPFRDSPPSPGGLLDADPDFELDDAEDMLALAMQEELFNSHFGGGAGGAAAAAGGGGGPAGAGRFGPGGAAPGPSDGGAGAGPGHPPLRWARRWQPPLGRQRRGDAAAGAAAGAAAASSAAAAPPPLDPPLPPAPYDADGPAAAEPADVDIAHAVPPDSVSAVLENRDLLKAVLKAPGLGLKELCRAACVSRLWRRVVDDPAFWRSVSLLEGGVTPEQMLRLCQRHRGIIEELRVRRLPGYPAFMQRLLPNLGRLSVLEVRSSSLAPSSFAALGAGLPALRELRMHEVLVQGPSGSPADALLSHPGLTRLLLASCQAARLDLACPALTRLSVTGTQISSLGATAASLTSLTHLHLAATSRLPESVLLAALTALTGLRTLHLQDAALSEDLLRAAARSLEQLTCLELRRCGGLGLSATRGSVPFAALRRLAVLHCDSLNSVGAGLLLEGCGVLEELALDGSGVAVLAAALPGLRSASLRGCPVLANLDLKCRRLERLELGPLYPGGPGTSALRRVSLASSGLEAISWRGLSALDSLSLDCPALTSLHLADCDSLTDEVFSMLTDVEQVVVAPRPRRQPPPAAAAAAAAAAAPAGAPLAAMPLRLASDARRGPGFGPAARNVMPALAQPPAAGAANAAVAGRMDGGAGPSAAAAAGGRAAAAGLPSARMGPVPAGARGGAGPSAVGTGRPRGEGARLPVGPAPAAAAAGPAAGPAREQWQAMPALAPPPQLADAAGPAAAGAGAAWPPPWPAPWLQRDAPWAAFRAAAAPPVPGDPPSDDPPSDGPPSDEDDWLLEALGEPVPMPVDPPPQLTPLRVDNEGQAAAGAAGAPAPAPQVLTTSKTGGCPQLRELRLEGCEGLRRARLRHGRLATLSLRGCRGLVALRLGCPALRGLALEECGELERVELAPAGLHCLSLGACCALREVSLECPALEALSLKGCGSLHALALACPALTELDATFCGELTDAALASALSGRPPLQRLLLSVCAALGPGLPPLLAPLAGLRHLDLSYTCVAALGPVLAGCPGLTQLCLGSCRELAGEDLLALLPDRGHALPQLASLDLSYSPLPPGVVAPLLTGLTHLTHLALSGCAGVDEQLWRCCAVTPPPPAGARAGFGAHEQARLLAPAGPMDAADSDGVKGSGAAVAVGKAGSQLSKLSLVRCSGLASLCLGLVPGAEEEGRGGGAVRSRRPAQPWQVLPALGPPWQPAGCVLSGLVTLRLGLSRVQAVALALPHLATLDLNGCAALRTLELRCPALAELHLQACAALPADLLLPLLLGLSGGGDSTSSGGDGSGGYGGQDGGSGRGGGLALLDAQHAGAFGEAVAAAVAAAKLMAAVAPAEGGEEAGPSTSAAAGGAAAGAGGSGGAAGAAAGAGGGAGGSGAGGAAGGVGSLLPSAEGDSGGGSSEGDALLAARDTPWWLLPRGATVLACGPDCSACGRRNRRAALGLCY